MQQSSNNKTQDQWIQEWINLKPEARPGKPWESLDKYFWFYNPTKMSSLRMSKLGANWLAKKTEFVFHVINLSRPITPKVLLQLERLLTEPYYIKDLTELWVHSDQDAIMLTLNSGNLAHYLDSIQENNS